MKIKKPEELTKEELIEFRKPQEAIYIYSYDNYPHGSEEIYEWWGCPRCKNVIEHEGQNYCGYCGQRVSWKNFYKKNK